MRWLSMNISLTPEFEKYIHNKVKSGFYTSVSEVVRESLRLMRTCDDLQKQRISQLNHAVEIGLAQLRSGEKVSASESYQRIKKKISKK